MAKSARSRAEKLFAASEAEADKALKMREKARQDGIAKVSRLRALRLAKEAEDKEAAAAAEAEKVAKKAAKAK